MDQVTSALSFSLEKQLDLLRLSLSSEEAVAAIDTLIKIVQNVIDNPNEDRYRRIRTTNKSFSQRVWKHVQARNILTSIGWILVDDTIVLQSESLMQVSLTELTKAKCALDESTDAAGGGGVSDTKVAMEKERLIRLQNLKEMQRRINEEKKRISDQIQSDRHETEQRESKPSHGRQRAFGANLNRFEDIGVDLNAEGG